MANSISTRVALQTLQQSIPSGYIIGRTNLGTGPAHLIPISEVAAQVSNAGATSSTGGGGGGGGVTSGDLDSAFGSTQGSILYRGASVWTTLGPGTSGQFLKTQGASANPVWATVSGGGLWAGAMGTLPTSAGTGLTNWLNQGGATVADMATGIALSVPSQASDNLRVRYKTAPVSTPYIINALIAIACPISGSGGNSQTGIGWYDGSAKLELVSLEATNVGFGIEVSKWTNVTTFNSDGYSTHTPVSNLVWLQIQDDGTNVTFSYGYDGVNFYPLFSEPKSSGWLGSSGYSNVLFYANDTRSATPIGSLMAWVQGT